MQHAFFYHFLLKKSVLTLTVGCVLDRFYHAILYNEKKNSKILQNESNLIFYFKVKIFMNNFLLFII